MRRRPQPPLSRPIPQKTFPSFDVIDTGVVLSGGGSRAAYQVGALRALCRFFDHPSHPINTIVGSSIGAVNGLVLAALLKHGVHEAVNQMELIWRERTIRNTFSGSPSRAFLRALLIAQQQLRSPGPNLSDRSVFDPAPLKEVVDRIISECGGLTPETRHPSLTSVGVMTTIEGPERKPLLFLSSHKHPSPEAMTGATFDITMVPDLRAKHGFASAALPSILPAVELDTDRGRVRLVDGGISINVPIDPAVRLGANRVYSIDVSGRHWWLDRFGEPHDTRPSWEVAAEPETFCLRPPKTALFRTRRSLGPILKEAVGSSTRRFIAAAGPVWPLFSVLKKKLGEEVAYESMTYVALDPEYLQGLIELGYSETVMTLEEMRRNDLVSLGTKVA